MAEEVFKRSPVASQQLWTKFEDLTETQLTVPVVAHWRVIEVDDKGEMKAVDLLTGLNGTFTAAVCVKQGLQVGDDVEVREGKTRDDDIVVLKQLQL